MIKLFQISKIWKCLMIQILMNFFLDIQNLKMAAIFTKLFSNSLAAKKQVYKFDLSSFWELFEVLVFNKKNFRKLILFSPRGLEDGQTGPLVISHAWVFDIYGRMRSYLQFKVCLQDPLVWGVSHVLSDAYEKDGVVQ